MSTRIYSFQDSLPSDHIYADTSFILNLTFSIPSSVDSYVTDCKSFLSRIQKEIDDTRLLLFTSDFAVQESLFILIKTEYQRLVPGVDSKTGKTYGKHDWQRFYKHHPEFIDTLKDKIDNLIWFIESIPFIVLSCKDYLQSSEEFYTFASNLIKNHKILPADAYHVVLARAAGIQNFIALDSDWFQVDNINLYTCLPAPK